MDIEKIIKVAEQAARAAGAIIMQAYDDEKAVMNKGGVSPFVTEIDKQAELIIRKTIGENFPTDIIIGEEFDDHRPNEINGQSLTWIIDPLDGTTAYISGLPTFTVLIGIWHEQTPVLGLIYQPLLNWLWVGGPHVKTTKNGIICAPAAAGQPKILATSGPQFLGKEASIIFEQKLKQADQCIYGGDGLLFALLASGKISIIVDDSLAWHDIAACVPVIMGAGGSVTDLNGAKISPDKDKYNVIAKAADNNNI